MSKYTWIATDRCQILRGRTSPAAYAHKDQPVDMQTKAATCKLMMSQVCTLLVGEHNTHTADIAIFPAIRHGMSKIRKTDNQATNKNSRLGLFSPIIIVNFVCEISS
jgi:hypothetical protein